MLKTIVTDYSGACAIVKHDEIMQLVFELMRSQKDLSELCCEILFTMSLDVVGRFTDGILHKHLISLKN